MADTPLCGWNGRHEWFREPGDNDKPFIPWHLMDMYEQSLGRNTTLIEGLASRLDRVILWRRGALEEWGRGVRGCVRHASGPCFWKSERAHAAAGREQASTTASFRKTSGTGNAWDLPCRGEGGRKVGPHMPEKFDRPQAHPVLRARLKSANSVLSASRQTVGARASSLCGTASLTNKM